MKTISSKISSHVPFHSSQILIFSSFLRIHSEGSPPRPAGARRARVGFPVFRIRCGSVCKCHATEIAFALGIGVERWDLGPGMEPETEHGLGASAKQNKQSSKQAGEALS
jgi:hypothetical protein